MSELLKAALDYASYGWGVFPCRPRTSVPANKNGCVGAVTDHEQIEAWWGQNPKYNIGLATGYSFWVLDIDNKNGVNGQESIEKLESKYGKLPDTVTQISGMGGKHLLFQQGRTVVHNGVAHLGAGLDVRGHHGYIMAAPSIHHISGRMYLWDGMREYRDTIAEAPEWLYALMAEKPVAVAGPADLIPRGQQHNAVLSFIGKQWDWGFTAAEIKAMGREFIKRCEDKFPVDEMERMVDSCSKYERKHAVAEIAKQLARDIVIAQRDVVVAEDRKPPTRTVYFPDTNWRQGLKRKDAANPMSQINCDIHNVIQCLGYCPDYSGAIQADVFSGKVKWMRPMVGGKVRAGDEANDVDCSIIQADISSTFDIKSTPDMVHAAIAVVAKEFEYHPIKDWLNTLEWDGIPRLDSWLEVYCGSPMPHEYLAELGKRWLMSAVARIIHPGCQAEIVPIFEGKQEIGKTSILRALANDAYFVGLNGKIDVRETPMRMRGKWFAEIAELDALSKSSIEAMKDFVTTMSDTYREPWGRKNITVPRQFVMAGTTNKVDYLADMTGNRRWWPVDCKKADYEGIKRDRNQIFAEAYALIKAGEHWYVKSGVAKEMSLMIQNDRREINILEEAVAGYLEGRHEATVFDIVTFVLEAYKIQAEPRKVGDVLRMMGWSSKATKRKGISVKLFTKLPSD